jgi:hypothetical protein
MNNNAKLVIVKNVQQIDSVISWYGSWSEEQRKLFLESLSKMIRPNLDDILNSFGNIKMTK